MPESSSRESRHAVDLPRDSEADLRSVVLAVWDKKWLVLAVGAAFAAIALVVGLLTPRSYEATVKLMVSPPKTAEAGDTAPQVSVSTFRALVENQTLAAKIFDEFKLGARPFNLSVGRFLSDCLSVDTIRDTNVIIVSVRLPDPALAAKVANRVSVLAVELSQRLSQDEIIKARDTIGSQVEQSRERLDSLQAGLEEYKKKVQVELLREDADAILEQRNGLLKLLVDIQAEKARLRSAEEQLAKRAKIDTVSRTIDGNPAMMEAARALGGDQSGVLGLQMKEESLNKAYQELEQSAAQSRTTLSALERQKNELVDVRKLDASAISTLTRLYEAETELARRRLEYDLAKKVYENVATKLEETRLQVVGRSAQLQAMDDALVPDRPVSPRILRNVALAFAVGVSLGALGALFLKVERTAAASLGAN